jgi:hypothetical protein
VAHLANETLPAGVPWGYLFFQVCDGTVLQGGVCKIVETTQESIQRPDCNRKVIFCTQSAGPIRVGDYVQDVPGRDRVFTGAWKNGEEKHGLVQTSIRYLLL